jgi:hypothetical protein
MTMTGKIQARDALEQYHSGALADIWLTDALSAGVVQIDATEVKAQTPQGRMTSATLDDWLVWGSGGEVYVLADSFVN